MFLVVPDHVNPRKGVPVAGTDWHEANWRTGKWAMACHTHMYTIFLQQNGVTSRDELRLDSALVMSLSCSLLLAVLLLLLRNRMLQRTLWWSVLRSFKEPGTPAFMPGQHWLDCGLPFTAAPYAQQLGCQKRKDVLPVCNMRIWNVCQPGSTALLRWGVWPGHYALSPCRGRDDPVQQRQPWLLRHAACWRMCKNVTEFK